MWRSWELFVLGCIVSSAQSQTDPTLNPRNVSLSWINEFRIKLSWVAPENFTENCSFHWFQRNRTNIVEDEFTTENSLDKNRVTMDGGFLSFSVQTVCPGSWSELVFHNITYPDLVKNFQCSVYSCNAANCSWSLANHVPDLQLFLKKVREHSNETSFQECFDYLDTADGGRSGCHLQGINPDHTVYFLINGTLNGRPVKNTFILHAGTNVIPPPLNLTVTQEGDHLNISWIVPDLATCTHNWKFLINYTECNEEKTTIEIKPPQSSTRVRFSPHCSYRIAIRSSYHGGETLSEEILYGDLRNPHAPMYAVAVLLPLMLATFAVLSFICFRKYKDKIFPKVPEPRDFLRDMFNNNNDMSPVGNLYVPQQEDEEDSKIHVLLEPLPGKPDD